MILPDRPMPRWEMRRWMLAILQAREIAGQ